MCCLLWLSSSLKYFLCSRTVFQYIVEEQSPVLIIQESTRLNEWKKNATWQLVISVQIIDYDW